MNTAGFFVLGASHHTAPIEIRERLALDAEAAAALHANLAGVAALKEITLLNTCNRIEFYGVGADPSAATAVEAAFCSLRSFDREAFSRFRLRLDGRQAVGHLLSVASGLDSQMLGETEIFGQVKAAYSEAQMRGFTGPVLNRIFQKAFQAAKHVRTQTAITTGQVSVANVAVELALTIFGAVASTRVLILGAGEIGEKTARAFRSRGAAELALASRSERAGAIAADLGARAYSFEERAAILGDFDIVVCSTAAGAAIVDAAMVSAAMRRRPARPLFLIDLAMPRDVDPAVAGLENVFLYNLDDLAKIADENRAARAAEIGRCREILEQRADALWAQIEARLPNEAGPGPFAPTPPPLPRP